ncbi:hypothetical protein LC612_40285, partial [Nostoc sp. CHAB 5834]|nr:hypothetical protein [Nostoc sp. CHAB 5834]
FPIPKNMNFLRTASYWEQPGSVTWFDNGWLFYKEGWRPSGACCWNSGHEGAVFSGDPVNTSDLQGRACQMIDLDLDALKRNGIRYAVWNILSYSSVKFADAKDVLATLQWGEKPCSGKLFEPSRAQMVFPLKGASLTKYIAYVDVVRRELVYLDANLAGEVSSAQQNLVSAIEPLKALLEHLESLPTVADVFDSALSEHPEALPVAYSDEQLKLSPGQTAFVFKPTNARNDFKNLDIKGLANV